MSGRDNLQPGGEKVKKALQWLGEMLGEHPEKNRRQLLSDAEVRFDLSPRECELLDKKLADFIKTRR